MDTRKNIAAEKKRSGQYNCAQSIVSTYCDLMNMDETSVCALTRGFAAGMGNMQGTCGAIVGATMVLSAVYPNRVETVKHTALLMRLFEQRNHATQCYMLKGIDTGTPLRACPDCVADAAEILEQILQSKKITKRYKL